MDVSPAMIEVGDQGFPAEDADKDDDEDVCRICRSPEEPGNPLRHPCACRGSIKYVHQDCLRLWLNRRGYTKCEVCGRSYSIVPVYSENAPERLPCNEFLIEVLLRAARYMKLMFPWIVVILFNSYCNSLHPWGQEIVAEFQRGFWISGKFASLWGGLIYSILIVCFMAFITSIRMKFGDLNIRRIVDGFRADNFTRNGLQQGVIGGVLQVLWKYFKILCDWYIHKLIHFLQPPNRRVLVPPNAPLDEFGVIRNLLFFLHDDAFAALAVSVCGFILFVLLPNWIGHIVLATVGGSGNSTFICGYMMMLLIPFAYLGVLFTLRHSSFPAIVRWFSLGFFFVTVELPVFLWVSSVEACKNLHVIKEAFVLTLKFVVRPWIIGFWLGICTSDLRFRFEILGTIISQIFENRLVFLYLIALKWLAGFCCLIVADSFRELIQEIIHKRAFWYLLDITDPDYKVTRLNLGYTFFAFATHGVLLVILVHLPVKAITLISPSFFSLNLWAYPFYFHLFRVGPDWLIKLISPASEVLVHKWIITVSSWLQLSDFLLVVPQGDRADQNMRPIMRPRRPDDDNSWFLLYSLGEGSIVILHGSQSAEDDVKCKDQRDNGLFLLRIALMLVLAALSMFLFGTAFMALPILAGRVFFDSISFITTRLGVGRDDLCGFWIGCYILQAIYFSTCFVFDHIQKGRTGLLLKYVFIRIRNGLFFSIWISVVPGLLGVLIDLMIIIPSRVPIDESPVYLLIQDWFIGLVVLLTWTFLTMLTPINWFATEAWRRKLERIRNVGIDRLPSMWLLRDVIGSLITTLLITLSIPYLFVKSLFPLLGFSQNINSAAERFIWPALLALITVWFMAKLTRDLIIYLHQLVFNERYLIPPDVPSIDVDASDVLAHGTDTEEFSCEFFIPPRGRSQQSDKKVQCYEPATMKYLGYFPALSPSEGVQKKPEREREREKRRFAFPRMDVSPAMIEVGDQSLPAEDVDKDDDEDVCRICRSPEEPGNPLRHPCACRGSIKYVHQDCLRLWLNRRGYKKCEVCGRSYSFVPVYSENAPERLPWNEFLIEVLLRAARYMKLMFPWIVVILFNSYCISLHPWGQEVAAEYQRGSWITRTFASLWAGLIYSSMIVFIMAVITVIRMEFGDLNIRRNVIGNGLEQGVIGGVLWKYMKILCDWYFHKFIRFLGPPNPPVLVPPNAPLDEFGVIRRLLFFLDDDVFAALAVSVFAVIFLALLPFCIGWIVLASVGGSYLSGNSIVTCGYMMMLSIPIAYFGILFTLRHNLFPAIVRWFSLGFHFFTVELSVFLWVSSVKACKNLHVVKDAFVLTFKIGVVPWIIGCWLEIYTSPMFRTTTLQRFEILSHYQSLNPLSLLAGFCFLSLVDSYRELIQEIIHKRAFWYLLDVRDPDYNVTKLNLGHTLFAFATHGVLLVILVHLPIKAITLISPSFFPLQLWVTDEKKFWGAYAIYFKLMTSGKWLIKLTIPAMKLMTHKWIITVSSWLQLNDYLLVVPRGDRADQNMRPIVQRRRPYGDNKWFRLYSLAEGSMIISHGYESAEDDIESEDQRDYSFFLLRIALMLVLAVFSMFLFATTFMALPIFAGRIFVYCTPFIMTLYGVKPDDLCAFWMGCYILKAIYFSTCFAFDQIQKGRTGLLLKDVFMRIRKGLFFSIWISVIPGLLGLLIDLMIIIPLRVPLDKSPVYFLAQDWWIGFYVLHIWTFLTMLTPINLFATEAWRRKLERIRNVGIDRLPSMWLLRDVIGSLITTLATTLSIPYLFVKYLFPLLGFSQSINSAAERFIWPVLLALITVWFVAKLIRDLIIYLHRLVFNERYLVGERVDNLTEE
ncbi:unnamed protein product [Microthlaspi erraticum]|uniref:RING-CH-type domain-containing protein n=1 Tax=Microthlaspi erraticum TaxID=1685480 RepID=A0A6D2HV50_9BRAS|nr:unnamed protein product [Microthlaspi erraticum]